MVCQKYEGIQSCTPRYLMIRFWIGGARDFKAQVLELSAYNIWLLISTMQTPCFLIHSNDSIRYTREVHLSSIRDVNSPTTPHFPSKCQLPHGTWRITYDKTDKHMYAQLRHDQSPSGRAPGKHVRVYTVQADSLVYRTPAVTDRGLNPSFSSPLYKPLSHARDRNDIANVSCVGVSISHRMH
jgi:hypothetical protein